MRVRYLDIAKGITLIFVMMSHSCGYPYQIGLYCNDYIMALFFIISGYNQKKFLSMKTYIKTQVKKIIVPYFQYNFLLYGIYIVMNWFSNIEEAVISFIGIFYSSYCLYYPISTENNIFFYRIKNNAMWFLTAFFCAKILFAFYQKYCVRKSQKLGMFLLCLVMTQILKDYYLFLPWNLDKAFIGAAFMIVGFEIHQYRNRTEFKRVFLQAIGIVAVAILYKIIVDLNGEVNLSTRMYGEMEKYNVLLYFLIGILGTVLCVFISFIVDKIPGINILLGEIGKNSLLVMSFHLIIFHLWNQKIQPYFPKEWINNHYWGYASIKIGITLFIILGLDYGYHFLQKKCITKTVL